MTVYDVVLRNDGESDAVGVQRPRGVDLQQPGPSGAGGGECVRDAMRHVREDAGTDGRSLTVHDDVDAAGKDVPQVVDLQVRCGGGPGNPGPSSISTATPPD